jgi:hypothetical protein
MDDAMGSLRASTVRGPDGVLQIGAMVRVNLALLFPGEPRQRFSTQVMACNFRRWPFQPSFSQKGHARNE